MTLLYEKQSTFGLYKVDVSLHNTNTDRIKHYLNTLVTSYHVVT